jgi:hypothetical protein
MAVLNTTSPLHSPGPVKDRPHKIKPSSNASNAFNDYLEIAEFLLNIP